MRKLSKDFITLPVCLTDNKDHTKDKTVQGLFKATEIIAAYPGYAWGAIVTLSCGTTFLTTATAQEVLEAMDNQQIVVKKKK